MGGTKILAAVLNSKEGIIARVKKATNLKSSRIDYIKSLAQIVEDVVKKAKLKKSQVKAVCLGIPASLNPITGQIFIAPNLGIKNFNIKAALKKYITYPVLIENDVNLGALGVQKFGVGRKSQNMLAVFIGTGIGGGLIVNGKIYRGSTFLAGEIGHIIVKENGPLCGCGNRGCFEAIASRKSIVNKIIMDINKNKKKSTLTPLIKSKKRIKSSALARAVMNNDRVVIKYLTLECKTIGRVLGSLTNFMNFDLIVLGGGLIEALHKFMIPHIKEEMNIHMLKGTAKAVKLVSTKLGDDAALFGGIALAEEFLNVKI